MSDNSTEAAPQAFQFYHYEPSMGLAVAFVAVFGISAVLHIWQLTKARTWYFIPFVIGCLCEYRMKHPVHSGGHRS